MTEERKEIILRTTQETQEELQLPSTQVENNNNKPLKITFYLTVEQVNKLDDLEYQYRKRTGKRINRNQIVRHLIDHCTDESLKGLRISKKKSL